MYKSNQYCKILSNLPHSVVGVGTYVDSLFCENCMALYIVFGVRVMYFRYAVLRQSPRARMVSVGIPIWYNQLPPPPPTAKRMWR